MAPTPSTSASASSTVSAAARPENTNGTSKAHLQSAQAVIVPAATREGRDRHAEQPELEQLGADDAPARGAERLVEHRLIFAPLLGRGHGAGEHQRADQKRDAGRHARSPS